jgi:hypothetical protein
MLDYGFNTWFGRGAQPPRIVFTGEAVMRVLHLGLALALLAGWAVATEAAPGKGKGKGKKGMHATHGVVVAVQQDKGQNTGTLTVRVHQHKKKGAAQAASTAPVEKTFKVTGATAFHTVQHVKGQKGQSAPTPATFAQLKQGAHVRISHSGDVAQVVSISHRGKKNK